MNFRIDCKTGSLVDDTFVIRAGLKRGTLKRIQPSAFRNQDGGIIRVAEGRFDDLIVGVFAREREGVVERYELLAYQRGDSWDNWTPEREEDRRRTYHKMLAASGIGNKERLLWGYAEIVFDPKNVTYSLWVVHRAASAP